MEKFKFKLENVLVYRKEIEEKKKHEFMTAQKSYLKQVDLLNNLLNEKEQAINNKENYRTGLDYHLLMIYLQSLDKNIENQKKIVHECESILNKKKEELLKSTKECKVIEKLKEKAYEEFKIEMNRQEQKQNDDFATHCFIQNERG